MTFQITPQGIITFSALVAAILALLGYAIKIYEWKKKQDGQDMQIKELKDHHEKDINDIKSEMQLLTYGILACLKGLKEQGCNGPVTEAINKIEKHLNEAAHH